MSDLHDAVKLGADLAQVEMTAQHSHLIELLDRYSDLFQRPPSSIPRLSLKRAMSFAPRAEEPHRYTLSVWTDDTALRPVAERQKRLKNLPVALTSSDDFSWYFFAITNRYGVSQQIAAVAKHLFPSSDEVEWFITIAAFSKNATDLGVKRFASRASGSSLASLAASDNSGRFWRGHGRKVGRAIERLASQWGPPRVDDYGLHDLPESPDSLLDMAIVSGLWPGSMNGQFWFTSGHEELAVFLRWLSSRSPSMFGSRSRAVSPQEIEPVFWEQVNKLDVRKLIADVRKRRT